MNTGVTGIIFELAAGKFVLHLNALIKLAMFQKNNYSPLVKFSRLLTCRYKQQQISGRSMISWLLMLIIIIAPFQASAAMHSNLNTQEGGNQTVQFEETAADREGHHCVAESEYCQTPLSACAAHFNCTTISITGSPKLPVLVQNYHHDLIADAMVSTRFPDPLMRPPRP
jgi:hypothetical protein